MLSSALTHIFLTLIACVQINDKCKPAIWTGCNVCTSQLNKHLAFPHTELQYFRPVRLERFKAQQTAVLTEKYQHQTFVYMLCRLCAGIHALLFHVFRPPRSAMLFGRRWAFVEAKMGSGGWRKHFGKLALRVELWHPTQPHRNVSAWADEGGF